MKCVDAKAAYDLSLPSMNPSGHHREIVMKKPIAFTAASALLFSGISIATAADDGEWVTCKDGMKMHSGGTCANHGGVLIETNAAPIKSTPINASKGVSKPAAAKAKTQKTATASKARRKLASTTRNPTAKCMDGAQYFSRERRGACASHGGVDKWYGW
jgi:hypothetical protein